MWATLIKGIVGGLMGALLDAWKSHRAEQALKKQGALETKEETNVKAAEARRDADRIRDRLRTDPEFAKRVRDRFGSNAGSE